MHVCFERAALKKFFQQPDTVMGQEPVLVSVSQNISKRLEVVYYVD